MNPGLGNGIEIVNGGNVGISKSGPGYLLDMEASGGGYYSASDHQWHNGSSASIKTNVVTMPTVGSKIDALRPVTYNCFSNSITTDKTSGIVTTNKVVGQATAGFIAEEVRLIIPEAVDMNEKDPTKADGLTLQPIVAALVKEVQELRSRVAALEKAVLPPTPK